MVSSTSDVDISKFPVNLAGVSIELLRKLCELIRQKDPSAAMTTKDVCVEFIKPWTQGDGVGYTFFDLMQRQHQSEAHDALGMTFEMCFGRSSKPKATVFISHAWKYRFVDLVSAIEAFIERHQPGDGNPNFKTLTLSLPLTLN